MIDPNAPAFPCTEDNEYRGGDNGISIRTWLAGQALAGLTVGFPDSAEGPVDIAKMAVATADAVIAALNASDAPTARKFDIREIDDSSST